MARGRPRKNTETLYEAPTTHVVECIASMIPNLKDDDILNVLLMLPENIDGIADKTLRENAAKKHSLSQIPEYNPQKQDTLKNLISVAKCNYNKMIGDIKMKKEATGGSKIVMVGEIEDRPVIRIPTNIAPFDIIFGSTTDGTNISGPPRTGVSLLAGSKGIGKTRTLISVASKLSKSNSKVIYFQNEANFEQFKTWVKPQDYNSMFFLVSNAATLEEQFDQIREHKPDFVIVDSINMLQEMRSQAGSKVAVSAYKSIAEEMNLHAMLIGHLNKSGEIGGSGMVPYMVDIVLQAQPYYIPGQFTIQCPDKNRFGPSGRSAIFYHTPNGVEAIETGLKEDNTWKAPEPGKGIKLA